MMTWAECAAAGMSKREAAEARQVSISAANMAAKRLGLTFRHGRLLDGRTWDQMPGAGE